MDNMDTVPWSSMTPESPTRALLPDIDKKIQELEHHDF